MPAIGTTTDRSRHSVCIEDSPRRVRVFVDHLAIADSRRMKLLFETDHLPVYYFPQADVRQNLLVPTAHTTHCPSKGDARYWSIQVGERRIENAVWNYPAPLPTCPAIGDLLAFYWEKVDAWYEEDEEVFVHPRDPYHRVDILESSRHVQILINGVTVADTHRPRVLFETGLPTRYYIHPLDVRRDLLQPTQTQTRCPYKGVASYWSVHVSGEVLEDVAWSYQAPIAESAKITRLICFYNEKVDLVVDGERQERPTTRWSR